MTNLAVLTEGLKLGEKAGIEPKLLQELLADTGANSFQLQVRGPWILNSDFANSFGVDFLKLPINNKRTTRLNSEFRVGKLLFEGIGEFYECRNIREKN